MKKRDWILLVTAAIVIALFLFGSERYQNRAEASSILNLQPVMAECVEEAKAAWLKGTGHKYTRDNSTAVAILAAEMFRQRVAK